MKLNILSRQSQGTTKATLKTIINKY